MNRPRPSQPSFPRRGFTLIEVLVVITILAILVAFLVPALGGASVRARIVQVKGDISAIEGAIAQFKSDYAMDPPSGIVLLENPSDWASPPAALVTEVARSRSILRQIWPQYDFTTTPHDINSDGDTTDRIYLGGAECLVFFLGGPLLWTDNNSNGTRDVGEYAPVGFSKNPSNPFAPGGNRQGPYFEFNVSRLQLSPNTSFGPSSFFNNEGFAAYRDPWPGQSAPYIYLSSYGGKGYRAADLGTGALTTWYTQGTAAASPAWSATKYQIISPGSDKSYGTGGPYQPEKAKTLLVGARADEADNITNFHSGRLSDQ